MLTQDLEEVRAASNQKPNSQSSNQCNDNVMIKTKWASVPNFKSLQQLSSSIPGPFLHFKSILSHLLCSDKGPDKGKTLSPIHIFQDVCTKEAFYINFHRHVATHHARKENFLTCRNWKPYPLFALESNSKPSSSRNYKTKHFSYIEELDI